MTRFATAQYGYAETGKQARVLGANAHQLVVILFDEMLDLLDEAVVHLSRNRAANIVRQQNSAVAILDSLSASLDDGRENVIAINLHLIYRQCKALIVRDDPENQLENISAAREILKEIASAWSEIG